MGQIFSCLRLWFERPVPGSGPLEPIALEPTALEPIVSEPIVSEPIISEPIAPEPIVSKPIASEPIISGPISPEPILPKPIASKPVAPIFTAPELIAPERSSSPEQNDPERSSSPEQVGPERSSPELSTSKQGVPEPSRLRHKTSGRYLSAPRGLDGKQSPSQVQRSLPRAQSVRFRVLIIGRANAGKTSILQRVCDTTESPEIYRTGPSGTRELVRSPF
jgi:hypothetical protein